MKYYIAYGSNLSLAQMAVRCPHAVIAGHGVLSDMCLQCRGEENRYYLTVEAAKGCTAPAGIWQIQDEDEVFLDQYEDYPALYDKNYVNINVYPYLPDAEPVKVKALIYVMKAGYSSGRPSDSYMQICREGYRRFGFDEKYLDLAYDEAGKD